MCTLKITLFSKIQNFLKIHLYERLSVQMMSLTFICALILASITTYMQVYHENEHFRDEINSRIELYHAQTQLFMSTAINEGHYDKIDEFLDVLVAEPYISFVNLYIYKDDNINNDQKDPQKNKEFIRGEKPNLNLNNTLLKTITITHDGNTLAALEIITNPDFISNHVREKFVLIISLSLFIAVSISATILLLMHTLIIKHLRYLANEAQKFSVTQIDKPIFLPNRKDDIFRNELDVLVKSINQMRNTISKEIKSNEAKNVALKNQRDFSNTLLNSCNLMICRLDSKYRILSINAAATLQTGYLEFEVIGKPWLDFFVDPQYRDYASNEINSSTYTTLKDITMHAQENHVMYLEWSFVPFYEGNTLKYHIAFGYDITKIKEAQQELINLNNELESKIQIRTKTLKQTNEELMVAYKDLKEAQKQLIESETMSSLGSLVSGIAHEINTPLGISVTAHTLIAEQVRKLSKLNAKDDIDKEELQEIIDIITESDDILTSNLKRASELIRSFKQVAVDSSSNVSYKFNLKDNLNQTLMSLSNVVKKEHLKITTECPDKIEIFSCPGALTQIYTNLIMNSANHAWYELSDRVNKEIFIGISLDNQNNVVIKYSDNGSGISEEIIDKIYEPFVTSKRGHGGSGLGANIIYNLTTQLLNGKIECRNLEPPLHGASFTITFPIAKEEKKG